MNADDEGHKPANCDVAAIAGGAAVREATAYPSRSHPRTGEEKIVVVSTAVPG